LQYDNGTFATTWLDKVGLAPDSVATSIIVSSEIVSGTVYGFRVRARNIFGWGPYSTVTEIKAAREPGVPAAPVTSVDPVTGGVAIAWTAPDARGDPITVYKIEIADKAGTNWYTEPSCLGTNQTLIDASRCVVLMSTLTSAPYNYVFNDLVQVRIQAKNFFLFGALSPVSESTGARIRVVPSKMLAPTEDPSCTDVTLTMNWIALSGADAGNSAVIAYSLYWDAGDALATVFPELTDALVTSFTVNGVEGGRSYRFKVRARNIYGYGPYSDATLVIPDDAPGKTAIPTVLLNATVPTEVEVSWPVPDDHSSPITAYEILFMKANGDFALELTRCNGSLSTVVA